MIDCTKITNYNRTEAQLEEFALFAVMVAGKNADKTASVLGRMLNRAEKEGLSPFEYLRSLGDSMGNFLVANKVGQYRRIECAFRGLLELPVHLSAVNVEDLTAIHGIGPKTARFILLHSRPGVQCAILDTHILSWVRTWFPDAPRGTPPDGKQYQYWESIAIGMMESEYPQLTCAEADLMIWSTMSGRLD